MSLKESEIQEVLRDFPELKVYKNESELSFCGNLKINIIFNDVHIIDEFSVSILVPDSYPNILPTIKETANKIEKDYPHINLDNTLCLTTDIEMQLELGESITIKRWIEDYVKPYFFSYCYYKRYGVFPFGERRHGIYGYIDFFKEYFKLEDIQACFKILHYICTKGYRGHDLCPCGSGKNIRNCHKDSIYKCNKPIIKNTLQKILNQCLDGGKYE